MQLISINPSFIASLFTCSFQHQLILRHRIVDWKVLMSTGGNCRRCTLLNRPFKFRSLRGCLHHTGPTFAPDRVHSGSLSWLLTFVYMIPPQNVMPARVTPARNVCDFESPVYFINMKCTFKQRDMKWPSYHVSTIRNQKVIPVWNSRRCEFFHVNTPLQAYSLYCWQGEIAVLAKQNWFSKTRWHRRMTY